MLILGLETSCDETAAAIVRLTPTVENPYAAEIISETVYSQFTEHEIYGGVVPEIAARAHAERLPSLVKKALKGAQLELSDLSGIAASTGPGLVGALLMGTTFGKTLALANNLPFYSTNHIEGHALTALLTERDLRPPYLLLLVSGGHCQLVHVKDIGHYTTLGSTLDDAIGECFDKVGKMCSLHDARFSHPYAPKVEIAAQQGEKNTAIKLPVPKTVNSLDFSFSGLKTAVRENLDKEARRTENKVSPEFINDLCLAFQSIAAKSLSDKTTAALSQVGQMPLVVSGGVAVNQTIRTALTHLSTAQNIKFYAPPIRLCADNAVMVAYTAALRASYGQKSDLSSRVRPRWPLEEMTL